MNVCGTVGEYLVKTYFRTIEEIMKALSTYIKNLFTFCVYILSSIIPVEFCKYETLYNLKK